MPLRPLYRRVLRGVLYVTLLTGGVLGVSRMAFGPVLVPSGSMLPLIPVGSLVMVNRLAYGTGAAWAGQDVVKWAHPQRGDVVVFHAPAAAKVAEGTYFLKRVVAVPGDVLEVRNQRLVLNGQPLTYAQIAPNEWLEQGLGAAHVIRAVGKGLADLDAVTVPDDCLFVMGDNRGASVDSRKWGCIPTKSVEGQVTSWVIAPR